MTTGGALTNGPWPSLLLNALLPWVTYQVLTAQGIETLPALAATAVFPVIGVALGWVRARRLDVLGGLSLLLIGLSLAVAFATENPLFVLVRGSVGNVVFGVLCFGSLIAGRPLMFYVARQFMAGWDREAAARFDAYRGEPAARRVYGRITFAWGVWLFALAAARVVAALLLDPSTFLALWPVLSTGGTFAMVYWSMGQGQGTASADRSRLDPDALRVLELAHEEAQRYGHPYLGTEHVLLALTRDPASAATRLLGERGGSAERVRAALERAMPPGRAGAESERPHAPRVRSALDHAASAAGAGPIGANHILAGLATLNDGLAVRALVELEVDLAALRRDLLGEP